MSVRLYVKKQIFRLLILYRTTKKFIFYYFRFNFFSEIMNPTFRTKTRTVKEHLKSGRIKETRGPINSLTFTKNSYSKLRLILDL